MTILLGESSVGNIDLESQHSSSVALLPIRSCTDHNNTPATRKAGSLWRRCFHAIVQVRKLLLLVNQNRARNNGNQLLLHHPLADVPYVAISIANNGVIDETDEAELLLPASPNGDEHDHNHREVVAETNNTSSNIGTATTADEIINQQKDRIAEITRTKDLISLTQIGGLKGVAEALNTDLEAGIPGHQEDLNRRTSTNLDIPNNTGHASTEAITSPSFFRIILNHCNNIPIMILFIAAGLSFGLGMKLDGPETGWYEGCFIMVSIIILVFAPAFRDLWEIKRSRRNRPMPILKQNSVFVYRGNIKQQVYVSQLVQGDVLLLETGCVVPADGLFIRGEFLVVHDGSESTVDEDDPFLFHGFMVTHGSGRMLVTAVGADTEFNKLMSFEASSGQTPDRIARWPAQLDWLCKVTHIIGLSFSVIILVVILVRVMLDKHFDSDTDLPQFKGKPTKSYEIMDVIERVFTRQKGNICSSIVALLVAMVGVVEGIPFIITFVSILRIKKMLPKEAYSDLGLLSSVTVGSGTVICTDKAPLNPIDVPMCFIGAEEVINTTSSNLAKVSTPILETLGKGISAPFVLPSSLRKEEDPLRTWACLNLKIKFDTLGQSWKIMKIKRLSSDEEGSAVLIKGNNTTEKENISLHFKGPASTILGKCSSYYDRNGHIKELDVIKREIFSKHIEEMQLRDLNTIAYACKRKYDPIVLEKEDHDLTLIAMVGMKKYTCCAKLKKTLKEFKDAQVKFILVSEDDTSELRKIAIACEILSPGGMVITGEDFQRYNEQERIDNADKICVMGNSLPCHRVLLMKYLEGKREVVVALGSRTNDILLQRQANIGVTMGRWSCQMVRESSHLEVFDGRLKSLLKVTKCGRCTYHNVQKYIQLEFVTNIAGTLIASITTMWLGSNSITGIQLLWTNFVTTFVIGPVLLMEQPNIELMRRGPIRPNKFVISKHMWRNMIIQTMYQTTILITFQVKGHHLLKFFKVHHKWQHHVSKPMIFNSFVFCQIFNMVNSRELEKVNVMMGIHQNLWFPLAVVLVLGLQVTFIEVAHAANKDESLSLAQWGVCFIIGLVSCPVDAAAKSIWNLTKKLFSRFHAIP
ncbi:hypothetical protein CsatB_012584 [Cannabis sativa]